MACRNNANYHGFRSRKVRDGKYRISNVINTPSIVLYEVVQQHTYDNHHWDADERIYHKGNFLCDNMESSKVRINVQSDRITNDELFRSRFVRIPTW